MVSYKDSLKRATNKLNRTRGKMAKAIARNTSAISLGKRFKRKAVDVNKDLLRGMN